MMAKQIGFEKLILKRGRLIGHFISNQDSDYFQSEFFEKILEYIKYNPLGCQMKEKDGKLTFSVTNVSNIHVAMEILHEIID